MDRPIVLILDGQLFITAYTLPGDSYEEDPILIPIYFLTPVPLPAGSGRPISADCTKKHIAVVTDVREMFLIEITHEGYDVVALPLRLDQFEVNLEYPVAVACGEAHTVILLNTGRILSMGDNRLGQLGVGNKNNRNIFTHVLGLLAPVPIVPPYFPCSITCGAFYTFVLTGTGQLFATGNNNCGQLGVNDRHERKIFTSVQLPSSANKPIQVACSEGHTFVLTETGQLYAAGSNYAGQLGLASRRNQKEFTLVQLPSNATRPIQVACSYNYTFVLTETGQLFSTGQNIFGQLGINSWSDQTSFTQIQLTQYADRDRPISVICRETCAVVVRERDVLIAGGTGSSLPHGRTLNMFTEAKFITTASVVSSPVMGVPYFPRHGYLEAEARDY